MSHKDKVCLYDKNNVIPIYDKNGQVEERNLNICVVNVDDVLQIKVRDPLEYCFNYTENIDLADFENMRVNQNLDIDFKEFKYYLIEMLEQFQKKEMFLKCQTSSQKSREKCTLIFYCKSKIKSIVYLTVDLGLTNQKEIFSELISNMQQIQDCNNRLKKQLANFRNLVSERDQQIERLKIKNTQVEAQFCNNLKKLENLFNAKIKNVENNLLNRVTLHSQRVGKLLESVHLIKKNAEMKSNANATLLKTIKSLQIEATNNMSMLNQLKNENAALESIKCGQDKKMAELNALLLGKDATISEFRKKCEELRVDLEKAAVALTQKKSTIDELFKDLLQANQMLINYNNHYDDKTKQVEDLQSAVITKDKIIREQRLQSNELLREYEDYKQKYNTETQEKLRHELFLANNKIEELEKTIRKANKINTLLTEKVNNRNFGYNQ